MKVGFIGLGIMGSRMAANILAGGHELTAYNRTTAKADGLKGQGASIAKTPAAAAAGQDVVITMLADPNAVRSAALGTDGFLGAMSSGTIWVDCSTVNPAFTREMDEKARAHGVALVDAPVAGSRLPAEKGELTILVGGDEKNIERVRPLLELMGKKIVHAGKVSMGTSMKMVTNLMLANAMAAFSEAMALGQALGIPEAKVADSLIGSAVTAPFLAAKRQKVESNDYEVEFPLRLMRKDLHLAALEAFENGISLPTTNTVKELFGSAVRDGLGDLDFSAVYRVLNG